jgi:putative Mn2+ efflux pump MntP
LTASGLWYIVCGTQPARARRRKTGSILRLHEIIGIGIALGIDCMVVSAAMSTARPSRAVVVFTSFTFGFFQFGMALAGMAGGAGLARLVDSPLRFAPPLILVIVGLVMILSRSGGGMVWPGFMRAVAIVGAAVSVSLDALGAGVAIGLAQRGSPAAAVLIGIISSVMSVIGFAGGRTLAARSGAAEKVGGLILIGLAFIMLLAGL